MPHSVAMHTLLMKCNYLFVFDKHKQVFDYMYIIYSHFLNSIQL